MSYLYGEIRANFGGNPDENRLKGPFEFQTSKEIFHNSGETTFSEEFAPFRKRKGEMDALDRFQRPWVQRGLISCW
uniref:Uncharacterized protein n=1 Tax=Solanum tuberosum TaxID=4113 RepID=M1B1A0_SOLTU